MALLRSHAELSVWLLDCRGQVGRREVAMGMGKEEGPEFVS